MVVVWQEAKLSEKSIQYHRLHEIEKGNFRQYSLWKTVESWICTDEYILQQLDKCWMNLIWFEQFRPYLPSPSLSNKEKASLNSAICSSVSCSAMLIDFEVSLCLLGARCECNLSTEQRDPFPFFAVWSSFSIFRFGGIRKKGLG